MLWHPSGKQICQPNSLKDLWACQDFVVLGLSSKVLTFQSSHRQLSLVFVSVFKGNLEVSKKAETSLLRDHPITQLGTKKEALYGTIYHTETFALNHTEA